MPLGSLIPIINELRESKNANIGNFQFNSNNDDKFKEQFLEKIENNTYTSKKAVLKPKIAGVENTKNMFLLGTLEVFTQ